MSLFLALIIILLVWFFMIAPVLRLHRISKQWQKTFTNAQKQRQQQRNRNNSHPQRQKKKIDPNVGEYVEFTETTVSESSTDEKGQTHTTHATEQQITDVTWEDI